MSSVPQANLLAIWLCCFDPAVSSRMLCRQHMERARLVQNGKKRPEDVGCHGMSPFAAVLEYLDCSCVWVLPVAHMLLHGVGKSLWKILLTTVPRGEPKPPYVLASSTRRLLQARAQEIDCTADFGRRCK